MTGAQRSIRRFAILGTVICLGCANEMVAPAVQPSATLPRSVHIIGADPDLVLGTNGELGGDEAMREIGNRIAWLRTQGRAQDVSRATAANVDRWSASLGKQGASLEYVGGIEEYD